MIAGCKLQGSHSAPPALQARSALPLLPWRSLPDRHAAVCCGNRHHAALLGGRPRHLQAQECGVDMRITQCAQGKAIWPDVLSTQGSQDRVLPLTVLTRSLRAARLDSQQRTRLCQFRSPYVPACSASPRGAAAAALECSPLPNGQRALAACRHASTCSIVSNISRRAAIEDGAGCAACVTHTLVNCLPMCVCWMEPRTAVSDCRGLLVTRQRRPPGPCNCSRACNNLCGHLAEYLHLHC